MHVLWHSDVALSAGDVVRLLSDSRNWKTQTAHVLLNRLLDKGYIEVDKSGYYHKFSPVISEEEYLVSESESLLKRVGGSVRTMVASLIDTKGVTDEDISAISDILEQKKREIERRKNERIYHGAYSRLSDKDNLK